MDPPKTVAIDARKIVAKIEEQNLKRWWIAQAIRIDARTLRRWLSGEVKKVQLENLELLAQALGCSKDELMIRNAADVVPSNNQLNLTADLIEHEGLVYDIFAEGKWSLIENILKSIIHFNMPKIALAKLYTNLSLLSWVQYKLDESEAYARKALEIGNNVRALEIVNRANVLLSLKKLFHSELEVSQKILDEVTRRSLDSEVLSLAYINLGINRWFYGAYGEAEDLILASFRFITDLKDGKTKSLLDNTAHAVLANIYFDDKRYQQSWDSGMTSLKLAQNSGYRRGIGLAHIRLAEIKAMRGETADAVEEYEQGMSFISPSEILLLVYESGSAIYRLHGNLDQAEKVARHGLRQSQSYTGEGTFYVQLAQLEKNRERHDKVKEYLAQAERSFRKSGCLLRLESIQEAK